MEDGRVKTGRIAVADIVQIGMMLAVIEVSKKALNFLPNVELVSFWIILFTIHFRWKLLAVIPAFILLEGMVYGFGLWWIMYLYAWPLLALLVWIFRKQESKLFWSVLSCVFGLAFGFLCSFPYIAVGAVSGGIRAGLVSGFTWWVAGIPWDIVHGVMNFVLMFVLWEPMSRVLKKAGN